MESRIVHAQPTPEAPWTQVGNSLEAAQTPAEVSRAAGFYAVDERTLVTQPEGAPVPDRKALIRTDTGEYLATVSHLYRVIQLEELCTTFVEAGRATGLRLVSAGTLGRAGVRAWLLAEWPGLVGVRGDPSPLRRYVLGYTGHDGMTGLLLKNTAVRVACENTLGVALADREGAEWHVPHTPSAPQRLEAARRGLALLAHSHERLTAMGEALARTRFTEMQLQHVLDRVLPLPDDGAEHPRLVRARDTVVRLFHGGAGIEGPIRGTAWAALQAVAEWADHHRHTRAIRGRRVAELRLESVWVGQAARLKRQALLAIDDETGLGLAA